MTKHMTSAQKIYIIDFMEKHPNLRTGKLDNNFTIKERNELWKKLTANLNCMGGPIKSILQWKKAWNDLKGFNRKRQLEIQKSARETGNSTHKATPLSAIDERLASLIGPSTSMGIVGIHESTPFESKIHLSPSNTSLKEDSLQIVDLLNTTIQASIPNISTESSQESLDSSLQVQDPTTTTSNEAQLSPVIDFADNTCTSQIIDDPPHKYIDKNMCPRKKNILTRNSYRERVLEIQAEANKVARLNLEAKNRIATALENLAEAHMNISLDFNRLVNSLI